MRRRSGLGAPENRGPCGRSASNGPQWAHGDVSVGDQYQGRVRRGHRPLELGTQVVAGRRRSSRSLKPARSRTRTAKSPEPKRVAREGMASAKGPGLGLKTAPAPQPEQALEVGAGPRRGGRIEPVARIHPGHELTHTGGLGPRPRAEGRCGPTRRDRAPRTSAPQGTRRGAGRRCRAGRWAGGVARVSPPQGRGFGLETARLEQPFERCLGGGCGGGRVDDKGDRREAKLAEEAGEGRAPQQVSDLRPAEGAARWAGRTWRNKPSLFLRQS